MPASAILSLPKPKQGMALAVFFWAMLAVGYTALSLSNNTLSLGTEWALWAVLLMPLPAWYLNRRSLRGLRVVEMAAPQGLHAHQRGTIALELEKEEWDAGVVAYLGEHDAWATRAIPRVSFPVCSPKRGISVWPAIRVCSRFPFSIFEMSQQITDPIQVIIYPAIEAHAPAWNAPLCSAARPGAEGEDMIALRDYVWGDALRTMDWKASARKGDWVVREFEVKAKPSMVFGWDQVRELGLEKGLERLAAWIVRAEKLGLEYGLILGATVLPLGRGADHHHACLAALAFFEEEAP